ncbi:MAG: acetamidase [Planctomycetaceae bacterium]|nr:acetamidase [Planctomycetaceae bacterium]
MQRISRDQISYVFDRSREPVVHVAAGERFEVETEDARTGQTRTLETCRADYVRSLRSKGPYYGNPVTGPIAVAGAEPGDTLAVTIHAMQCDTQGFAGYWPFVYHLQDWFAEPVTELVEIRDSQVRYTLQSAAGPHELRIPVRPMIGCIGTAPYLEVPTAGTAGRFGGNLDVPEVAPGSTIYLPVAVPGALLYLGDCHPYQGDGEVSGCEMRAVVTASCRVLKGWTKSQNGPRVESATQLVTVGAASPAEVAQWQAIREMIVWLEERYGWTKADARLFLTLVGDLRPGQMQVSPYTMRLIVPKDKLPA